MNKKHHTNEFILFGSFAVMIVKRQNGDVFEVLLDLDDVERVKNHNTSWCAYPCSNTGRVYIKDAYSIGIHRFIVGAKDGEIVDHINHDSMDNRKCNLRITDYAENAFNRAGASIRSQTGVRGVQPVRDKYRVLIARTHYGYFDTLEEAKSVAETIYRERSCH